MNSGRLSLLAAALVLRAVVDASAAASPCSPEELEERVAQMDPRRRPGAAGIPTELELAVMLVDLRKISELEQLFHADLRIELSWHDERLAPEQLGCDGQGRRLPLDSLWHPQLILMNAIAVEPSLDPVAVIQAGGRLRSVRRYTGEFSNPMQLADFPLEVQRLVVVVGTALLGPDEARIRIDEERSGIFGPTTVAGWSIDDPFSEMDIARIADLEIHRIKVTIPATRNPGYYLIKVMIPLLLIVAMSWSVFWLDPSHCDAQLGVATASVFALIAFQLSLGDILPPIPYLTRMDRYVVGSMILVFLAVGESVCTTILYARSRLDTARKIDRVARCVFPLSYGLYIVWCAV